MTDLIEYGRWWRLDKKTMSQIVRVWSTLKLELNCHDWLDQMQSNTKSIENNDVTNCIGVIFIEYNIKLSRPIRLCEVYDEDETRQRCDQSNRVRKTYKNTTWPIV